MKIIDTNGTFDDVLADSNDAVKALAARLRALIIDVYPDVTEVPWSVQKNVGYGVGPKKMSEHFSYIAPQKAYVNLGFMFGANLPDPEGLLEGTGKLLRHVKIQSDADIDRPAVRTLIEHAVKERLAT